MRAPSLALLAILFLAGGVTACGESDEDAAAETVRNYLEAFASGDGEAACRELSDRTKRVLVPRVARGLGGAGDCPDAIRELQRRLTVAQADALKEADVTRVELHGETAEVRFRADPLRGEAQLRRSDGDWKISLLPGTR